MSDTVKNKPVTVTDPRIDAAARDKLITARIAPVSYTHLTLPTIYSV